MRFFVRAASVASAAFSSASAVASSTAALATAAPGLAEARPGRSDPLDKLAGLDDLGLGRQASFSEGCAAPAPTASFQ